MLGGSIQYFHKWRQHKMAATPWNTITDELCHVFQFFLINWTRSRHKLGAKCSQYTFPGSKIFLDWTKKSPDLNSIDMLWQDWISS